MTGPPLLATPPVDGQRASRRKCLTRPILLHRQRPAYSQGGAPSNNPKSIQQRLTYSLFPKPDEEPDVDVDGEKCQDADDHETVDQGPVETGLRQRRTDGNEAEISG